MVVGRLSREKDHLTLLEAVRKLAMPAHTLMVGEGPERTRIEDWVRATDRRQFVTLTGQVSSAEPYYAIADVAALSSLSEGSPNALLEAMAAGVPVVATSVGGIPEIVMHEKSALLVSPGDRDAMAAALARLLGGEPDLASRLAAHASQLAEWNHSPEGRVGALSGLYRNLLSSLSKTPAKD